MLPQCSIHRVRLLAQNLRKLSVVLGKARLLRRHRFAVCGSRRAAYVLAANGHEPKEHVIGTTHLFGKRSGLNSVLIGLGCIVIVAVWAVVLERIAFERAETIAAATKQNASLARTLEEHTLRTLLGVDQTLHFIRYQYGHEGLALNVRNAIAGGDIDDSILTDLAIINEDGLRILGRDNSKRISVADRDYFKFHERTDNRGLFIGQPTLGRITGKWAIHISLRINNPDGSFGGVALAAVDPGYFTKLYERADLGEHGLVTLVGLDGIVRARQVGARSSFGEDMRGSTLMAKQRESESGSFTSVGKLDGIPRFYSFRTLLRYPLIVAVGTPVEAALAAVSERAHNYRILAALATALAILFVAAVLITLSQQQRAAATLHESERFAHATIDALSKSIAVIDASGRILLVNRAWREFARGNGAVPASVSEGSNYLDVCDKSAASGDAKAASAGELLRAVIRGERCSAALEYPCHAPSEQRWFCLTVTRFSDAGPVRVVVAHENITERKAYESHIEYLATHDALTDLPNRNLLNDRITQAINHARRLELELAVVFVDLDNFKYVNDGFGHAVGDELLRVIAQELRASVRSGDTVARLSGDEFVLLLDDLQNAAFAGTTISRKLLERFAQPFVVGAREFTITASIGISLYPGDGQDPEMLLMNADAAMYRAKETGRNTFQFSAPEMKNKAIERVALEGALRRALQLGQFELYYQPLVLIATGKAVGVEALIRWNHSDLGLIAPAQFIPMAEETGLIIPIGEWVLRTACVQNKAWQDAGLPPLTVSVNLSALQLRQAGLVDLVARILDETGLDAHFLDLELTETMVMGKSQSVITCLHALKALGVTLSIDDFGTGYSNLGYFRSFPLDQLKIDRSFVNDLPKSSNAASIARAIVSMAHSLGLRVVAEGVETDAQAQFLASICCEHAQGYLYSKPLPAAEFALWLDGSPAKGTKTFPKDKSEYEVAD
jgi:diguanylate cyclase (GGDEF)-like protein